MPRTYTMGNRAATFILTEEEGHLSRENGVVIAGNGRLQAGTVLQVGSASDITTSGSVTSGSKTISSLDSTSGLVAGRKYNLSSGGDIDAGVTAVWNGGTTAVMNLPATGTSVSQTLEFTHTSGMLEPWTTGNDAVGILIYPTDTGGEVLDQNDTQGTDVPSAYVARLAEVNGHALVYPLTTDAEVRTSLAALNIIVRD